jgi:hypothetical protein
MLRFGWLLLVLLLVACSTPEPSDPRARLVQAERQQQADLATAGLSETPAAPPAEAEGQHPAPAAALVTLKSGEVPPSWQRELPRACEMEFWCGMAFVDNCPNPNSCRAEAETRARNDLRKRIAVRIRSRTVGRLYRELDSEGESGSRQFEQEIREKVATVELKDVRFAHFYWIPKRQHMVLARMVRSPEPEAPEAEEEKTAAADWFPVRLVAAGNAESEGLGQGFREHLALLLREQGATLLEGDDNETASGPVRILTLSLSARIDAHKGQFQLFRGKATVYLTLTVQDASGAPLARKTWTARRFVAEAPEQLSASERQEVLRKTLEKGLKEYESELLIFLRQHLQS